MTIAPDGMHPDDTPVTDESPRGWLDRRIDLRGMKQTLLDRGVPGRLTWWHTLGSATLTVLMVQIVTGAVLATYYSPSPDHAYESVQFLQRFVLSGALLRGIHAWGASAMVVLTLAHMVRVFMTGAYKFPREPNWLIGIALLILVLAFGFTGYLLPWDQRAYWATQVGTSMAGAIPVVGSFLGKLLRGGSQIGAATLTRFYAIHVFWLPFSILALIGVHLLFVVRQGIAARTADMQPQAPAHTTDATYPTFYHRAYAASKRAGDRFWPDIIAKDIVAAVVVVAVLVFLGSRYGASLEAPANPTDTTYVPRPEWYFLPLYQLLKFFPGRFEGVAVGGVPALVLLVFIALPFFDRRSARTLLHRPIGLAAMVILIGGSAVLMGAALRDVPPGSAPDLASSGLSAVERSGRATFVRQCASCHVVHGSGGDQGPELTEIGLRHSSAWLHSFMENPKSFRGSDSKMLSFGPPALTHQGIEEVARYLTTLRGVPGQNRVPDIRDTFPDLAKLGLSVASTGAPALPALRKPAPVTK